MATHLIIVPGHAIWKLQNKGEHPEDWHLEPFQLEGNDHLCFVRHIEMAMSLAQDDPEAMVVFSGGQTKLRAGCISEAQSYYLLARELNADVIGKCYTEEFARDSFENVLFSIARFKQITGAYPKKVSIVGFEFKMHRFINLHLKTIKFDMNSTGYVGIDPKPPYDPESKEYMNYYKDLRESEHKYAVSEFEKDPLGNGAVLRSKKESRNPFNRCHGYTITSPELMPFFGDSTQLEDVTPPWVTS